MFRDQLITANEQHGIASASFRGVPFLISAYSADVGRRNVVIQFAKKDNADWDDLGRKAPEYTFDAFIKIDSNWQYNRNKLLLACENHEVPGRLVHPFLGTKLCVVTKCVESEDVKELGMAKFALGFAEVQMQPKQNITRFGFGEIDTTAFALAGAMLLILKNRFLSNSLLPSWSVQGIIDDAVRMLGFVNRMATVTNPKILGEFLSVLKIASLATKRIPSVIASLSAPGEAIGNAINDSFLSLDKQWDPRNTEVFHPGEVLKAMQKTWELDGPGLLSSTPPPLPATTPNEAAQGEHRAIMQEYLRGQAISAACRAAVRIPYASYNDAVDARDSISQAIDDRILTQALDAHEDVYSTLLTLRSQTLASLNSTAATLAKIVYFITPGSPISALMLAYKKYDDLGRDQEILGRNQNLIKHPGFIPEYSQVELLAE